MLRYSVDLRKQMCTEPVLLEYGKVATNFRGCTDILQRTEEKLDGELITPAIRTTNGTA